MQAEAVRKITTAEYFALPESQQPTELIDGEIIVSPAPVAWHQIIVHRLTNLIELNMPSGFVLFAPIDVHLDEYDVPQPDILWAAVPGRCRITAEGRVEGVPDLIVEVVSPSSVRRDRRSKYALYERHGVREYWIADPKGYLLEVYTLVDGKFQRHGAFEAGETFSSPALGKTISLESAFPVIPDNE